MIFRIILMVFSILGISSTFMPWLHYPKSGAVFYGYVGDGLITGTIFLLSLLYLIFTWKRTKLSLWPTVMIGITGFMLAINAYYKIQNINLEKLNYVSDNPLFSSISAGFYQGIGIYVFGIAGLGLFVTALFDLVLRMFVQNNIINIEAITHRSKSLMIWVSIILVTAGIAVLFVGSFMKSKPSEDEIKSGLSSGISAMGDALKNERYDEFITYTHPAMLQNIGGVKKTIELLKATNQSLIENSTKIKNVTISDVHDIQYDQQTIQAIVTQKVSYDISGKQKDEMQKLIAISNDQGKSWKYINIGGKSREQMIKLFPLINSNLKF